MQEPLNGGSLGNRRCSKCEQSLFLLLKGLNFVQLGSVEIYWGYAYSFAMRNKKNFLAATPLRFALNSLIFALNDSAIAFEERWL